MSSPNAAQGSESNSGGAAGTAVGTAAGTVAITSSSRAEVQPLFDSLQSNLFMLLRHLGQLLAYQSQLRMQHKERQRKGLGGLPPVQVMPGWKKLVLASQRWQRNVSALSKWANEAQEALAIEYKEAKERESSEAALKAAKEATTMSSSEKDDKKIKEAADGGEHSTKTAADVKRDEGQREGEGEDEGSRSSIIDLTAEDADGDDAGAREIKTEPSTTSNKRPRDAEDSAAMGAANTQDDVKRQKMEPGDDTQGAKSQPSTTAASSSSSGVAASTAPAMDSMPSTSSMALPDFSGIDFSAFMNLPSGGDGGDGADGNLDFSSFGDMSAFGGGGGGGGGSASGLENLNSSSSGGANVDNNNNNNDGSANTNANNQDATDFTLDSLTNSHGRPFGGEHSDHDDHDGSSGGGGGDDPMSSMLGGDGMDFSAALEGVDWNSLLDTFNTGDQQ